MSAFTDAELYQRGNATLIASWEAYARAASDARVERFPGVVCAVFPHEPERGVYNNAVLGRDLGAGERKAAMAAMETAYALAGIERFAAWVHEGDVAMRNDLEARGYMLDTATRAMGMDLADLRLPRPEIELASLDWGDYLRLFGLPPGLLAGADLSEFQLICARLDGKVVATSLAFDHDADCGIYNVGTLEHARRRGLGTALTGVQLHEARDRGCRTASLQATPMAERVYSTAGFRDLGRFLEYVPFARHR
jgi:GNAT superfamily N-acetyltransferase